MERKTKIVATVGEARGGKNDIIFDPSEKPVTGHVRHDELLSWLIEAGANVIRINMSFAHKSDPYGANEGKYLTWLDANKEGVAKGIAVIGDLPGPKIRLGGVSSKTLTEGDEYFFNFGDAPPVQQTPFAEVLVNRKPFSEAVRDINGQATIDDYIRSNNDIALSLDDGNVKLQALGVANSVVRCRVTKGGELSTGKGLTIKGADLSVEAFQSADRKALDFLLTHGGGVLAFVCVSFAQTVDDILDVKEYIQHHSAMNELSINELPGVIAKIETTKGYDNIKEILDVADGIMVARGDLGEQTSPQAVPSLQKELIALCNARGKPVITATQMLDSMEDHPEPRRSEAADVFNAILDGTDAVMTSGETSRGRYPSQTICIMAEIALAAERYYFEPAHRRPFRTIRRRSIDINEENTKRLRQKAGSFTVKAENTTLSEEQRKRAQWCSRLYGAKGNRSDEQPTTDRISEAACTWSESGDFTVIVAPTTSGRTPRMISRFRPRALIIGVAHYRRAYRQLLLSFGVQPVYIGSGQRSVEDILEESLEQARNAGHVATGDQIVATSGTPLHQPGTTNLLQLIRVPKS